MKKCLSLFSFLLLTLSSISYASNFSEDLANKIPQLSQEQTFIRFSLKLTGEEEKILAELETKHTNEYDYFGDLPGENDLVPFIESLGNSMALSSASAKIITQKIQDIKEAAHAESVWVAIRSSHNMDEWEMPRWHIDGSMYDSTSGFQYKTVFILKGAGTLFCNLSDEGRLHFNSIEGEQSQILGQYFKEGLAKDEFLSKMTEYQYKLAKLIQEYKDKQQASIEQGEVNQGAIFIVGDKNAAAIHSEPHINGDRLFVSVVTGTKEQIHEIRGRFNQ